MANDFPAPLQQQTLAIRSGRTIDPDGVVSWTVINERGLPVEPVDAYLGWLTAVGSSPNTTKSYARHLSLFFRWLHLAAIGWEDLSFDDVVDFVEALSTGRIPVVSGRSEPRSGPTMQAVLAAVEGFLEYHRLNGNGPTDLRLRRETSQRRAGPGSFLEHISQKRTCFERRIKVRPSKPKQPHGLPEGVTDDDLFGACRSERDKLLVSLMLDGGLRVGQATGVHHADLDAMRKNVTVVRRLNNRNNSISKQRQSFTVALPTRTMDFYRDYLLGPLAEHDIQESHVLVNLQAPHTGTPMLNSGAAEAVQRIGARLGIDGLHPHQLRHEHGTQLARAGWTAPEIAKRLGHAHFSSADPYIHLTEDDIEAKYRSTMPESWGRDQ